MKKTISTILVCVLLVGALFSLASCEMFGIVSGTYSRTDSILIGDVTTTYEFSGKDVTVTVATKIGNTTTTDVKEGKYDIGENDEGQKTITFTVTNEDGEGTITTYTFNSGKDDNGSYIEIDGTRYNSVK